MANLNVDYHEVGNVRKRERERDKDDGNLPGAVCQLRPPINILLKREQPEVRGKDENKCVKDKENMSIMLR